jgi:hypothetical protein
MMFPLPPLVSQQFRAALQRMHAESPTSVSPVLCCPQGPQAVVLAAQFPGVVRAFHGADRETAREGAGPGSATWDPQPARLLRALQAAARTTARQGGCFAWDHVSLQGRQGQVVATDGIQL